MEVADRLELAPKRFLAENVVLEVLEGAIMDRIRALGDLTTDRKDHDEIMRLLAAAERMNISSRRFVEAMVPFEDMLRQAPSDTEGQPD